MSNNKTTTSKPRMPWVLTLGALGVVFGDIGTSPLYALRECFSRSHHIALNTANVLGVLSLIFWSLIIVVSIKYLLVVLRADNRGEGGVLALMTLASSTRDQSSGVGRAVLTTLGLFGAALLYGDGVITPAISVLSAVEGVKIVAPSLTPYIVPLTIAILFLIFFFQKHGTGRIGSVFGPFILVWFFTIGLLGAFKTFENPVVLSAINPYYAFEFFATNRWNAFLALGGVFLAVTGGEALYADMGHFGRFPIRLGWFCVALPGLLLNYFGQGSLLLDDPTAITNPFYLLAPDWALIPLLVLATCATIIASQAVIAGAFSLTRQAVQLGYLPRLEVQHTSRKEIGQIYVAPINWILMLGAFWIVLEFGSSAALASAYGVAVSATMVITTALIYFVSRHVWNWHPLAAAGLVTFFLAADLSFFSSNIIKVEEGGWVPLVIASGVMLIMTTWRRGRQILAARLEETAVRFEDFVKGMLKNPVIRIPGTAIFMARTTTVTPPALLHNVRHNKVLHDKVVLLQVVTHEVPYVSPDQRLQSEVLDAGFYQMTVNFGFMDTPDVPRALVENTPKDIFLVPQDVTFFLGRETLFATERPGMAIWRERLFAFLSRNAQPATKFFCIPTERVIEVGLQVEL